MQKTRWDSLALLIVLMGLAGCSVSTSPASLGFTRINGGTAYSLTDGTAMSGTVVIPATWKGLPVTAIGDSAFLDCAAMTSLTIPAGITSIGASAFHGCSGLSSLTIPDSVTSIGDGAFFSCIGLSAITLPSSLAGIMPDEFYGCSSLTALTLPASVTTIGPGAFDYCEALTTVSVLATTPPTFENTALDAFASCYDLATIYVPVGDEPAYATAPGWSPHSSLIIESP